jgi:hypothetical protein
MSTDPDSEITNLIRGLDSIDWVQLRLTARLTPAQRVLAGMRAQAFAMAALRGTLRRRFPNLTQAALNMKVLEHFTPVRMNKP